MGLDADSAAALCAAARRVPLVRAPVADFAARHAAEELSAAFAIAYPGSSIHAATVLAVAAAHRGARLDPGVLRQLLPELEGSKLFTVLLLAVDSPFDLALAFLDDRAGVWESEAIAVLFAAEELAGKPAPQRLVAHARRLARRRLHPLSYIIGAAAMRLADPHLDVLAESAIAIAKKKPSTETSLVEERQLAPLDALHTVAPPRIASGFTVRRERVAGRNDPCPCGSGKKFKKCCADKAADVLDEPPSIDPRLLSQAQVADLRPHEVVELDPVFLSHPARIQALRRLIGAHRWSAADRVLHAVARADDTRGDLDDWRLELIDEAIRNHAHDVVQQQVAKLDPESIDRDLQIRLDCMSKPPDLVARLNEHARAALDEGGSNASMSLAYTLLDTFPALGIFVARGALEKGRDLDSYTILEAIEEARDEIGVAPFEPWWDLWDEISQPEEKTASRPEEVDQIANELRRARKQADAAAAEATYLQQKLRALEAAPRATVATPASTPSVDIGDVEAEKKRLRTKVAELQRIVSEGQDERRELRQRLAEAKTDASEEPRVVEEDEDDEENDDDRAGQEVERPRRILIPRYAARAAKAIAELSADMAEAVLVLVAELAAGRANAWRGVKRLRLGQVFSVRAGIHYRILFRVVDGALDVAHVTHRRDLEQAIASLE